VIFLPAGFLKCLPGKRLKLLAGPGAVVVLLVLEALVLIDREQHERLLGPRVDDARRRGVGMFQGLHLLFGQFDHGCLLTASYHLRTLTTSARACRWPPRFLFFARRFAQPQLAEFSQIANGLQWESSRLV